MKHKIDLKDVTFLIPVRIDSVVRLENLLMVVEYLTEFFETHIRILEANTFNNEIVKKIIPPDVEYSFVEDKDPIFYRTKYLNIMTDATSTSVLALWDADVIVPVEQIVESVNRIRMGQANFVYPYDGRFYDTSRIIRELYYKHRDIEFLKRNISKMKLIYGDKLPGGAVFASTDKYIESGKENLKFYGWGPEDFERLARWKGLKHTIQRIDGCLFHFTHSRGINSKFRSFDQAMNTSTELLLTKMSSEVELKNGIYK